MGGRSTGVSTRHPLRVGGSGKTQTRSTEERQEERSKKERGRVGLWGNGVDKIRKTSSREVGHKDPGNTKETEPRNWKDTPLEDERNFRVE